MQNLECARNHRQPVEGQTTGVVATTVPKMQGCEVLTHSVSPSQATHTHRLTWQTWDCLMAITTLRR